VVGAWGKKVGSQGGLLGEKLEELEMSIFCPWGGRIGGPKLGKRGAFTDNLVPVTFVGIGPSDHSDPFQPGDI